MTQTSHDTALRPRLFPVPASRPLGLPDSDGPDGGDDDEPVCVDCRDGIPVGLDGLRPGDLVTELGTPTGPWYPVLEVDPQAGLLVLDGRDADDPNPLPVRILSVDVAAGVIKYPGSPAT